MAILAQQGVSGRWIILSKSRWTYFWFCRDTTILNFIHWCQCQAYLLFEDYWKRDGHLRDTWVHAALWGLRYLKGNYLKPVRLQNISFKKFDILPMSVIITPDEVYDTYVEIDKTTLLDVKIYNSLIQKANM